MVRTACRGASLPNRETSLPLARQIVDDYAREAGFSEIARSEICLAVHEAVTNAFRYGSPAGEADSVDLQLEMEGSGLVVSVRDHGPFVRLPRPSLPDPASFAGRGRGLFLMCCLMDKVQFDWIDGTVVRMTKWKQPENG
jgi:anti-sigma regulatory factor (Ser/Thr protein kinase)